MTLKFSPPARVAVSACLFLLLPGPAALRAQSTASASPSPTPKPKASYLRFWNLLPKTSTDVYVLASAADPNGKPLQTAAPSNYGSDYEMMPPGHYTLNVCRNTSPDKPIKTFDVPLRDKDYVSIVVHPATEPTAAPEVEMTMDSLDPTQPVDNRLTIRQCLVNARVIAAISQTTLTDPLSFGGSQVLKNLPKGAVPVALSIAMAGGGTNRMTTEADFTSVHRITLLIIKDAYGRIRPRVVPDGPSDELEAVTPSPAVSGKTPPAPTPSPATVPGKSPR